MHEDERNTSQEPQKWPIHLAQAFFINYAGCVPRTRALSEIPACSCSLLSLILKLAHSGEVCLGPTISVSLK